MIRFLVRRSAWMLITLWSVFTISFFLMRVVPGGPFDRERALPEDIQRNIEARFNLDLPLHRQYGAQLWNTICLDFGPSFKLSDYTVNEVIAEGFPISASLGIIALSFAIVLGVTAGTVSAIRPHSLSDVLLMSLATLGIAVPNFILASLAIVVFVFVLHWFPAAGWGSLSNIFLPAICLGAPFAGYIARLTRTEMLEVLGQDYVRTAYAKGLKQHRVIVRHVLRGAMLPVVSYLGPAIAGIMTGSLVLERIFAIPGMGSHFIDAAIQRDYTLAMGMVMVYTVMLYTMNTMVDIAYALIDPRVTIE